MKSDWTSYMQMLGEQEYAKKSFDEKTFDI